MDIPQVGDQVRKAPTQALRAVFAGIGKILLAADRPQPRPRPAGPKHAAPGGRAPQATGATATAGQRWRSLDETGNVRLLSTEEVTVGHGTVVASTPVPGTPDDGEGGAPAGEETAAPVASQPLSGNVPIGAGFVVHELPLPGYDTMSLASIRARLRSLDFDQLQAVLLHERKNAERPEVIAMIERRIAKLESGG